MIEGGSTVIRVIVTPDDEDLVRRTVRWVSVRYGTNWDRGSLEDLYHYGLIGLIEAKRGFDKNKKIPFQAFAVHRVKGAMIDHLRKSPVVRLPQKKQELRKQLDEARHYLSAISGEASEERLAEHLDWSVSQVREVAQLQVGVAQLIPEGQDERALIERDIIASNTEPEAEVLKQELALVVQRCLQKLQPSRDRLILIGRILHDRKLRELADCMKCSMETIRLRQQQAMASMRRCLESSGWDGDSLNEI